MDGYFWGMKGVLVLSIYSGWKPMKKYGFYCSKHYLEPPKYFLFNLYFLLNFNYIYTYIHHYFLAARAKSRATTLDVTMDVEHYGKWFVSTMLGSSIYCGSVHLLWSHPWEIDVDKTQSQTRKWMQIINVETCWR